jgi:GR25 family glycosyltransferase involved in LPS biosynthesis
VAVHLLTDINSDREKKSINSISTISNIHNVQYNQIINEPYTKYPPAQTCTYPNRIGMVGNTNNPGSVITPGAYGCFRAHTDYITNLIPKDDEIYLFFEADAQLNMSAKSFINIVYYSRFLMENHLLDIFNFGTFLYFDGTVWEYKSTHIETNFLTATHCYMLLKSGVMKLKKCIETETWQTYDFWLSEQCNLKFGIFSETLCSTFEGESLIEKNFHV